MKKTISQRFFLSLCLMIVGCLWGSAAWAESFTYSFSITPTDFNGDSYAANNTDHTTTAVCTNNPSKTMEVTWYSYQVMLQSGVMQWQKSKGYIYNKTDLGTIQSVTVTSSEGKFTTYYGASQNPTSGTNVEGGFFNIKVGGATGKTTKVTVTFVVEENPDVVEENPELTTSTNSISFGDIETGYSDTNTFSISGTNLTPNSTASLTIDDNTNFSVTPSTINVDADGKIAEKNVTVTYAPKTTGKHSATLTISSPSDELSRTVSLTGTGVAPKTHYTVTWMVNNAPYTEGTPTTDVTEGGKVETLPTNPAAIGSNVFMGWTASAISGTSKTAPLDLFTTAPGAPAVTGNTTYYAVFAKKEGSEPTEELNQTLAYDTWTYSGSTTDKSSYRLFHKDSYIESAEFDRSKLSKVIVYGGTFGGNTYNQLSIGDGTNTWKDVTVRGSEQTGVNTYTDGTPLSGTGTLRVTSKSGKASGTGVRISKVEIFIMTGGYTYTNYATTIVAKADRELSFGATTAFEVYNNTFEAPTLEGTTSGVSYASSNASVATVNASTGAITLAGGFGTTTITASAAEDETHNAGEASYTLSVWPNSIAGLKTMVTGTVDFKAQLTNATITYVNGRNVYLQDADAAILMYLADDHGLTAGKSYSGLVSGTATLYNGLREITSIDLSTPPADKTIEPEVVTLAALNADYDKYESMYVKVAGVTTGTFTTSDPVQTTTLTQDEATLAFAAPSSISLVENNDYDFVGFLGKYNSTPQFKIYEESQATNKGKLAAGLVFEQASYTVEVGELITVKATNASGAAITYSVNDETNCLVDENKGEFVAYAAGTYTITATCPATETHMAGTATCQVTVTMPASNISATTYYKKITSTDELVDGGVYLIVCEAANEAMGSLNSSSSRGEGKPITISGNTYTGKVNQSGYPYEITISQAKNGNYNLYHASGYFINGKNGNDLVFSTTTGDDGWSVIFDEDGNVEISNSKKAGNYIQRYTTNNYYKNYSSTSGGQTPVQLYQKVGEMPIAQVTGGITTYVADFAYSMPQHLVGHTVELVENTGVITTYKAFRAGDEVPALTPLLIKSTEDFTADETKTYNPAVLNKTLDAYDGDNMLEYQRDASNMTKSKKTNVYYYKLAIKKDVVGFYWGEPEGGAFQMTKPSTAYLTVPKTMSVQGFVLNLEEGEPTGITTVTTDENAPIYNLQGIRMNGKNLPKGIYIQGGKKFMVK